MDYLDFSDELTGGTPNKNGDVFPARIYQIGSGEPNTGGDRFTSVSTAHAEPNYFKVLWDRAEVEDRRRAVIAAAVDKVVAEIRKRATITSHE